MKITALLENTTERPELRAEHGLSLFVEIEGQKILFDMGQTDAFAHNAEVLGVDLASVGTAVLSHGHYDHGGGLAAFLERNKNAPVYLSRFAFEPHYHGAERYIGVDVSLKTNPRLRFSEGETVIAPGLTLYSCNHREREYPIDSSGLLMRIDGALLSEDFRHEQYLLVEERGRRVLFSGCSHKGILNIVRWFQPDVLIGGFHFSKLPLDDALAGFAECLNRFPTEYYTCHCTGAEQFAFMKERMARLHYLSCGQTIEV